MSKNRRLKRRARQSQREKRAANREDKHHICYQRRSWNKGAKGVLRQHWYCTAYIPKDDLHRQIHEALLDVPAPRESSAKEVLRHLNLLASQGVIHETDPIEMKLKILAALFDCIEQPTADALRVQLQIVHEFNKKSS